MLQEVHIDSRISGDRGDLGGARVCNVAREVGARMTLATMQPSRSWGHLVVTGPLRSYPGSGLRGGAVVRRRPSSTSSDKSGKREAAAGGGSWIVEHSPVVSSCQSGA